MAVQMVLNLEVIEDVNWVSFFPINIWSVILSQGVLIQDILIQDVLIQDMFKGELTKTNMTFAASFSEKNF